MTQNQYFRLEKFGFCIPFCIPYYSNILRCNGLHLFLHGVILGQTSGVFLMSVARIRSLTFPTKETADRFEKVFAKIGATYLPMAESNIGIRTDEFTCVCVTVYPDNEAAEKGLASVAEWRDHHPEILEAAEDIFYLEGEVTNFM